MKITKLAKEHGEKMCSVCGLPHVNSADYFYRTSGKLRPNCIKCEDRRTKNHIISELKNGSDYKKIVAQKKEIQELKRTTGLQSVTIQEKNSEIDYLQGKQRGLEESIENSKLWNKGLFACLILWIIGSWLILLI